MIENLNDVNVLNYLHDDIINTSYSNALIKKAIKLLEDNNKTYFLQPKDLGISRFPSDFKLYQNLNEWAKAVYEDNIVIDFEVNIYLKYLTASLNKTMEKWYHEKYHKTIEELEITYIQKHIDGMLFYPSLADLTDSLN
jgi:hypothetical protein